MTKYSSNTVLEKIYAARTDEERREAYNEWSRDYDQDVSSFGIQLPYVGACVFSNHVSLGTEPILDAACGTGMHTLPLKMMGYDGFHGIDISDGMLAIAKERGIYDSLQQMVLGKRLEFEDNHFAVSYTIGALATGHAPPESLDEFIRVTKPGGLVIWSTHAKLNERSQAFHDKRHSLEHQGLWKLVFETKPFVSMPQGDSAIEHSVYVYSIV